MNKLIIIYDPNCLDSNSRWSDGETETLAKKWCNVINSNTDVDVTLTVSNALSIFAFRYLVSLKEINHKQIVFRQGDEEFLVDVKGKFIKKFMPKYGTYCYEDFVFQLCKASMNKK